MAYFTSNELTTRFAPGHQHPPPAPPRDEPIKIWLQIIKAHPDIANSTLPIPPPFFRLPYTTGWGLQIQSSTPGSQRFKRLLPFLLDVLAETEITDFCAALAAKLGWGVDGETQVQVLKQEKVSLTGSGGRRRLAMVYDTSVMQLYIELDVMWFRANCDRFCAGPDPDPETMAAPAHPQLTDHHHRRADGLFGLGEPAELFLRFRKHTGTTGAARAGGGVDYPPPPALIETALISATTSGGTPFTRFELPLAYLRLEPWNIRRLLSVIREGTLRSGNDPEGGRGRIKAVKSIQLYARAVKLLRVDYEDEDGEEGEDYDVEDGAGEDGEVWEGGEGDRGGRQQEAERVLFEIWEGWEVEGRMEGGGEGMLEAVVGVVWA